MHRVRTALAGCGKVGQIHAQALADLAESEFVAACDVDLQRALSIATCHGVRPYDDVTRMLQENDVQALLVATPHPVHVEPALCAATAGVHVLVEKPLAASLNDCDAMLEAAKRHGTKLGVISQRRWYEPVRRMKAAIDAGKIGRPVLGCFVMYSWRDPSFAMAGSARSWPAWRRNREFIPRCTFMERRARRSGSRPTAARRSSPACRQSPNHP